MPSAASAITPAGNSLRRTQIVYDADETERFVDRSIALLTSEFFADRAGWGCPAPDPIFILGMPRAGSTLVEQILASHSAVEGTTELPDLPLIARHVADYPDGLAKFTEAEARALGEDYLKRASVQRRTDRPFFIDKLPNNWAHVGLIRLILPNARIIERAARPAGVLLLQLQAAFRARPGVQLRAGRHGPLLSRLCAADGVFGCSASQTR